MFIRKKYLIFSVLLTYVSQNCAQEYKHSLNLEQAKEFVSVDAQGLRVLRQKFKDKIPQKMNINLFKQQLEDFIKSEAAKKVVFQESNKALIEQLKKEIAELRDKLGEKSKFSVGSDGGDLAALLKAKEARIAELEKKLGEKKGITDEQKKASDDIFINVLLSPDITNKDSLISQMGKLNDNANFIKKVELNLVLETINDPKFGFFYNIRVFPVAKNLADIDKNKIDFLSEIKGLVFDEKNFTDQILKKDELEKLVRNLILENAALQKESDKYLIEVLNDISDFGFLGDFVFSSSDPTPIYSKMVNVLISQNSKLLKKIELKKELLRDGSYLNFIQNNSPEAKSEFFKSSDKDAIYKKFLQSFENIVFDFDNFKNELLNDENKKKKVHHLIIHLISECLPEIDDPEKENSSDLRLIKFFKSTSMQDMKFADLMKNLSYELSNFRMDPSFYNAKELMGKISAMGSKDVNYALISLFYNWDKVKQFPENLNRAISQTLFTNKFKDIILKSKVIEKILSEIEDINKKNLQEVLKTRFANKTLQDVFAEENIDVKDDKKIVGKIISFLRLVVKAIDFKALVFSDEVRDKIVAFIKSAKEINSKEDFENQFNDIGLNIDLSKFSNTIDTYFKIIGLTSIFDAEKIASKNDFFLKIRNVYPEIFKTLLNKKRFFDPIATSGTLTYLLLNTSNEVFGRKIDKIIEPYRSIIEFLYNQLKSQDKNAIYISVKPFLKEQEKLKENLEKYEIANFLINLDEIYNKVKILVLENLPANVKGFIASSDLQYKNAKKDLSFYLKNIILNDLLSALGLKIERETPLKQLENIAKEYTENLLKYENWDEKEEQQKAWKKVLNKEYWQKNIFPLIEQNLGLKLDKSKQDKILNILEMGEVPKKFFDSFKNIFKSSWFQNILGRSNDRQINELTTMIKDKIIRQFEQNISKNAALLYKLAKSYDVTLQKYIDYESLLGSLKNKIRDLLVIDENKKIFGRKENVNWEKDINSYLVTFKDNINNKFNELKLGQKNKIKKNKEDLLNNCQKLIAELITFLEKNTDVVEESIQPEQHGIPSSPGVIPPPPPPPSAGNL